MARLNDDGSLDFGQDDWATPAPPKKKVITDPGYDPGDGTTGAPLPAPGTPTQTPGTVVTPPTTTPTASGGNDLDAYLASLAAMPGADPSLAKDPGYWKDAINSRGGLTDANKQYWQDASVGPTAFFNNPNRESGGAPAGGGSNGSSGSGSQLSDFLMQLLTRGGGNNTDPARSALMGRLNSLMDQYSQPVTADDPTIKASTDAYTGQVGRSVNAYRKTAAERAYAEGVPTGSFDSAIGNAELGGGRAIGDMQTQLMRDEMLSRRQNLMSTLQSAGGLLSAQDSADIQNKIANMDAMLKSAGLDVTSRGQDITSQLGNRGLDIQDLLGRLNAGNSGTAINNQNNQFYDKLGSDNANEGAQIDLILRTLGLK